MGAFATQFEVALKEANLRQVDVAKQTNGVISQTMASRYVNGGGLPEVKNLEPLVKIFPAPIRERLVTAYLLEHIPESARDLVTVHPVSKAKTNSQPVYGKAIHGSELAKCLAILEERAMNSPAVRDAVISTVRAMLGEPLNKSRDGEDGTVVPADQRRDMPIFGSVPAGAPCDNPQLAESFIPIPKGKKYPVEAFALRVRGDSMIGKGINDGDVVVVHKREANNGDVVVALIDGETTLKTLIQRNGKCKLRSENPRRKTPVLTDQSAIQAVMIDKLDLTNR